MKNRFGNFLNKNLKVILVFGIVVVLAFGILLMLISGNHENRDQVTVDPTAEQQEETKPTKERKLADSNDYPGVSATALALYNARVDDISDTAQVAQLVEASDMREEMGGYIVTLGTGDNNSLHIAFEKQLKEGEDLAFDEAATWYAEQFLALIEEAEEIVWSYQVEKNQATIDAEKEEALKKAESEAEEKDGKSEDKDSKSEEKDGKSEDKDSKSEEKDSKSEDKDSKSEEKEVNIEKYKNIEKSLTVEQADELLGTEVKGYSGSPELVQTLLNNQKGIV